MSTADIRWTPEAIEVYARRYLAAERRAQRRGGAAEPARLGMMCCAAARFAYDIGPMFIQAESAWGWPDVSEGAAE